MDLESRTVVPVSQAVGVTRTFKVVMAAAAAAATMAMAGCQVEGGGEGPGTGDRVVD